MHKKTIVLLTLTLTYNLTFACDLCTVYLGIQPNDFKNSFSLRHRYTLLERDYVNEPLFFARSNQRVIKGEIIDKHGGEATDAIALGESYRYAETYNSYDVVANIYLSNKLQLNTSINFSDNYLKQNDSITDNIGGIGDLKLLLKYQLYNSVKTGDSLLTNKLLHRLTLGGGITLPTGNYNKISVVDYVTEFSANTIIGTPIMELNPHLQAGTGSFGYLALLEYFIKRNSFGVNANVSYQLNTTNKNNFRFANRFNANSSLFVLAKLSEKIKTMPKLGLSYEKNKQDIDNDITFINSGGEVLFLNYGFNLYINKLGIEFTYYKPIKEYLMGIQAYNKNRIISQLTYYF